MDYRVIDTLQTQLQALAVEVERRHDYIAALNATRDPGTPEVSRNILADATIQERTAQVAKEARALLLETLAAVEGGETLPPFVRDFVERLTTVAPLLSYDTRAAGIWDTQAGALLARLAPYLAQESAKAAGMGNNPAAQVTPPREPLCIPTTKSREDLRRIFHALAKARYIDGAPEALPDFLNAFAAQDSKPTKQGRIAWVWIAKNGNISPLQILDFAARIAGRGFKEISAKEDAGFIAAVSAIFGVTISPDTLHRYNYSNGTETSAEISRILQG